MFWAVCLVLLSLLPTNSSYAQGRSHIKSAISSWGSCRNVAITKTNGDLALNAKNAYAATGLPQGLSKALSKLNDDGEFIDDVVLTESGRYLILYGNNGIMWNDIPYSLERKLREYNEDGEVILSVTMNDAGDWIVISKEHYSASDTRISEWLKDGNEKHGMLWSVCLTDDALVAVFAHGYKFAGNVPQSLRDAIKKSNLDVFRLKIAGSAWFFADMDGNYKYNM